MNFDLPPKAFLSTYLNPSKLNGAEKFLVLSALLATGSDSELNYRQLKKAWRKSIMGIQINPSYKYQAKSEGWIKDSSKGLFTVTSLGYQYLDSIQKPYLSPGYHLNAYKLGIFTIGETHNFDRFLRSIFAEAASEVLIADSYVDGTIFDTLLDQIPENIAIKLLYGNRQGTFSARVKRFKTQYRYFTVKEYGLLHDRFLIIDGTGYIVGPSLKDAARKSPAVVVKLDDRDTQKLKKFFFSLWGQAKLS